VNLHPGSGFWLFCEKNLFDVESKSGTHKGGQLDEQHVPAEVVEGVGDEQRPEGNRQGNIF